ncbi:MAG: hypothetical protein ACLTXW_03005 [Christensenellales bacterium]
MAGLAKPTVINSADSARNDGNILPQKSGNILGKVVTFYGNNLFYVTSEREHSIFFQFENVPANVTKNVTRKNPKTLEKQGFLSEW